MSLQDSSLWDAVDTEAPAVRHMHVARATPADCHQFAERYHYSGHAANQNWRYGLWHGVTLWGIAGYNLPTRETTWAVFGRDYGDHVAHLSRLALADNAPRNSESRLIAGSLRLLAADQPHLWAVVTYADTLEGHVGYVYQATNALYTGLAATGHRRYVTADGRVRGDYDGHFINRAEAVSRGWTVVEGTGKHRYVYLLGSRTQRRRLRALLQLPVLPYPKGA